ncbi:MAG: hypothetical protein JHC40_01620 [Burkholderiales bacterium]|nr:hypothetical protein [Burkholderiales bacterium]
MNKRLADGRYRASVSVRSGSGNSRHDRVLRLIPTFTTQRSAAAFAMREGIAWVAQASNAKAVPAPRLEA